MGRTAGLVLVRHGESEWNAADRFAGWVDVALTDRGRAQAVEAGHRLREAGVLPDVVHTSLLRRAIGTADLMLGACGRVRVPVHRTWRLNERHYGALQGLRRGEAADRYGAERMARWRRGFGEAPPSAVDGRAESLADVRERLRPYWLKRLLPDVAAGRTTLVVSHGNTLRILIQFVQGLDDDEACALDVPTGEPRCYAADPSRNLEVRPDTRWRTVNG